MTPSHVECRFGLTEGLKSWSFWVPIPIASFRAEAWIKACESSRKAEHFNFSLEQLKHDLAIEPQNLRGLREQGICLQRLVLGGKPSHSLHSASVHYRKLLDLHLQDPVTWALLGCVNKDAWVAAWRHLVKQQNNGVTNTVLRAAIDSYANGYCRNLSHCYSGINSFTLMYLHRHLTNDPRFDREITTMWSVHFAAECESNVQRLFYPNAALDDLEVVFSGYLE